MRVELGRSGSRGLTLAAVLIGAAAVVGCAPPPAEAPAATWPVGDIVDLTHPLNADAVFWPTAERFALESVSDGLTEAGFYYAANNFQSAEHGGTHIDAPVHFAEGRQTVDQIPLRHLIGPAVVVDVSAAVAADPDYQVTVEDIQAWEREHGRIPAEAILVFRTGFSSRWPDAERYLGTAERGDGAVPNLHFPGLHPDAARWIVDERPVAAVGLDTASIDYGQSTEFESHRILYDRNIPAFENLAALDRLPPRGATLIGLPMLIEGGSGAPVRAIAIVPLSGR